MLLVSVSPVYKNTISFLKEKESSTFLASKEDLRLLGSYGIPVTILGNHSSSEEKEEKEEKTPEQITPVIENLSTEEQTLIVDPLSTGEANEEKVVNEEVTEEITTSSEEKEEVVKFTREELESKKHQELMEIASNLKISFKKPVPSKKEVIDAILD